MYPSYKLKESGEGIAVSIHVLTKIEAETVPELFRPKFIQEGKVVVHEGLNEKHFMTPEKAAKHTITSECFVSFSNKTSEQDDYHGMASDLFTSAYKFSRK